MNADAIRRHQARIATFLADATPEEGRNATPWPGLSFFRSTTPRPPAAVVYTPSLCIVAQGAKMAAVGDHHFRYDPLNYLVLSVPMPVEARVVEASVEAPFLSMALEVDPALLGELMIDMAEEEELARQASSSGELPPIFVSAMDERLCSAVWRFLQVLDDPMDRRILGPQLCREIVYHVLSREQGVLLRAAARRNGASQQVTRAIRYIEAHFDQPLDVPTIAQANGMSTSSLHHTFKSVTSLSPIQYLKQIRLHRARRLMLEEGCGAGEAAHRVGYGSASQFSREFKRFFGASPSQDVDRLVEL